MLQAEDESDLEVGLLSAEFGEADAAAAGSVPPTSSTHRSSRLDGPSPSEPGRWGFTFTCCGLGVLIAANFVAFLLVGIVLCSFTHMCDKPDYRHHQGYHHKYHGYEEENMEQKKGIRMVYIILIVLTAVNVFTVWYLCKPNKAGRRVLRAGFAVFRLCDRPRAYEEDLVPFSTLYRRGFGGVASSARTLAYTYSRLCLLPLVLGIPLAFILWKLKMSAPLPAEGSPLALFLLLVFVAVAVMCLWKHLAEGDCYGEKDYLDSIAKEEEIVEDEDVLKSDGLLWIVMKRNELVQCS